MVASANVYQIYCLNKSGSHASRKASEDTGNTIVSVDYPVMKIYTNIHARKSQLIRQSKCPSTYSNDGVFENRAVSMTFKL